uniref:Arabinogalactan protein AGP1 n=1 Tax=Triticum aestivum TaxID=4565 RepID=Q06I74_WHEAT|nr:arabinogalactan protein AGP1 [Triticum aestivum]
MEAERKRRVKLNPGFYALRAVVPQMSNMDEEYLLNHPLRYLGLLPDHLRRGPPERADADPRAQASDRPHRDNSAVARLWERRLYPDALARVLSLHVLLDYLGDARLRTLDGGFRQAASLYHAHGAPGAAGFLNFTRGGQDDLVSFRPAEGVNGTAAVFYVKSVKEAPWDIAVLQVSDAISSFTAEAKVPTPPAPAPAPKAPAPAPLAPVVAPAPAKAPAALPPSPKNHTAPPPKPAKEPVPSPTPVVETPAEGPGADGDQPPADEHKSGASDSEPWSLGAVVAVAVPVVVFLLW